MLKVLITDTNTGEVILDKEVRAIDAVYTTAEDVTICAVGDSTLLEAAYRITRFDDIENAYYQKHPLLKLLVGMFRLAIEENGEDIMSAESDDITFDELLRGFLKED
jgi:hypothetical protein